ncbi:hypothetical protein KBX08_32380 [Micromonospora sp. H61]|uniref:hypothetical protein n=1 Tax=Micromonospora sp. H61 TaxID=2824888 RepID=UPI001B36EFEA|nr:hypothetical protein [Micromonospora sp. H61]MBQ0994758.1 hypothetical protein [Micromonospora sp. H61]
MGLADFSFFFSFSDYLNPVIHLLSRDDLEECRLAGVEDFLTVDSCSRFFGCLSGKGVGAGVELHTLRNHASRIVPKVEQQPMRNEETEIAAKLHSAFIDAVRRELGVVSSSRKIVLDENTPFGFFGASIRVAASALIDGLASFVAIRIRRIQR